MSQVTHNSIFNAMIQVNGWIDFEEEDFNNEGGSNGKGILNSLK